MQDLISRQAAIEALGEKPLAWTEGEYDLGLQNQWQSDVDALNGLPSVQPERKKGKWIGKYPVTSACSECNYLIHDSKVKVFAYCPNCGAYMMGEQYE